MAREIEIKTINDAHIALGLPAPKHPLVSIIKNDEVENVGSFDNTKSSQSCTVSFSKKEYVVI